MLTLSSQPIRKIEAAVYDRKFLEPVTTAVSSISNRAGIYLRAILGDGTIHYGEAAPLVGLSLESVADIQTFLRNNNKDALLRIHREAPEKLPSSLVMALDSCLLERVQPARSVLELNALIPSELSKKMLERHARSFGERGFKTFKFKVGPGSLDSTIENILFFKEILGSEIKVRLDANKSFSRSEMPKLAKKLELLGLEYLEDPFVDSADSDWHKLSKTPLAIDFSPTTPVEAYLAQPNFEFFILKPTLCGGLRGAHSLMARIHSNGKKGVLTSALETEVGLHSILNFSFGFPYQDAAYGLSTSAFFERDYLKISGVLGDVPNLSPELLSLLEALSWEAL